MNDTSFFYEPETSVALGFGFRCGFLGLLHMEIIQERLEREFDMDMVHDGTRRVVSSDDERRRDARDLQSRRSCPTPDKSQKIEEPIITAIILTPEEHVCGILKLCQDKRGMQKCARVPGVGPRAHADLRAPAQRSRARLLRQAEDACHAATRSLDYHVTGYLGLDRW
ncbi:MAG: hypothetical protein QM736_26995 [Vicinamibacterales bacterium]